MKHVRRVMAMLLSVVMVIGLMSGVGAPQVKATVAATATKANWKGTVGTGSSRKTYTDITYFNIELGSTDPYYVWDMPKWTVPPTQYTDNTYPTWKIEDTSIVEIAESRIDETMYVGNDEVGYDHTGYLKLNPKKAGKTNIIWQCGDVKEVLPIYVRNKIPTGWNWTQPDNSTTKIAMNGVGDTYQLQCTSLPVGADLELSYSSRNPEIATVSNTGLITAVSEGAVFIDVYLISANEKKTKQFSVNISSSAAVTGMTLDQDTLNLNINGQGSLTPQFTPANAANKTVTCESSNSSVAVAEVLEDGTIGVLGRAAGTAVITVTSEDGGYQATCTVTVAQATVKVTGVSLSSNSVTMQLGSGQMIGLTATVSPSNATNKQVTWTSSNKDVATVSGGTIQAKSAGEAIITVTTKDGGYTASCTVTVTAAEKKVTSVTLNKTTASLNVGETETLTATVAPADADNKALTWTSSNTNAATVDAYGKVTAKSAGTAVITATAADGSGKSASCTVTVKQPVTAVSFDNTSLSITEGDTKALTATILPADATNKALTWESNKTDVATVDASGKVTALAAGTAVITATAADGSGKSASCTVTVLKQLTPVTGISLTYSGADATQGNIRLTVGQLAFLTAAVSPENATDKSVSWSSSNKAVVEVTGGRLQAVSKGTARITATAADGSGVSTYCDITVVIPVTGISFSESQVTIDRNQETSKTISLVFNNGQSVPENTDFTCISSDTSVATVTAANQNGAYGVKVTPLKSGRVSISVVTKDGGYAAYCNVNIVKPVTNIAFSSEAGEMKKNDVLNLAGLLTVTPSDADNTAVSWSSTDEKLAKVSSAGQVEILADSGTLEDATVTITATAKDGSGKSASYTVTVKPTMITSIKLTPDIISLTPGGTADYLIATVAPEDATVKTLTWKSSNENVASVDSTGMVTAKGNVGDTAVITATASDGSQVVSNNCTVQIISNEQRVAVESVTLQPGGTTEINDKQILTVNAVVLPDNATVRGVKWESTDSSVVEIVSADSESCRIQGLKPGTATLTALAIDDNTKTATLSITVKAQPVEEITLENLTSATIKIGETFTPAADVVKITPDTATSREVVWSSSDTDIAEVDAATGVVTAKAAGTAVITVTAADGSGKSASYTLTVETVPVSAIGVSPQQIALETGGTYTAEVWVLPENATNKNVIWSSSDEAVATVENGVITAVAEGTAIITARAAADATKTATITVTVADTIEIIEPESVTIDGESSISIELTAGDSVTIGLDASGQDRVKVLPETATDKAVTWSSSDEAVATASARTITAVSAGTATITLSTVNGKTAEIAVTVKASGGEEEKAVETISVSVPKTDMKVGETQKAEAVITPADAANQTVTWASSNPNVLSVDAQGNLTAISAGTAVITAKAANGKEGSLEITVAAAENPNPNPDPTPNPNPDPTPGPTPDPIPEPTPDPDPVEKKAQTITVKTSFTKVYGSKAFSLGAKTDGDGALTYKSSNTKVVKVSAAGKVTIKGTGKATITVTAAETSACQGAVKVVTITIKPKKASIKKVISQKKASATVTWKKDTKVSGYEITLATDKKFKKNKKTVYVKSYKKTKATVSKLKSKKTYYVRIRGYKTVKGKKVYGAYSKVLQIKVK